MKKNISINISGIIFHIEEDGYDTLKKYLDAINSYFSSYEDSEEIISDIEGRIAEIFLDKLADGNQVVSADDVSLLIKTMGSVADFAAIEEEDDLEIGKEKINAEPEPENKKEKKSTYSRDNQSTYVRPDKLYRDLNKKVLGGVASGIGHYYNIDPLWVRVGLLLFFFSGGFIILAPFSGIVFLAYFIMWAVTPGSDQLVEDKKLKKLYRDPDDRVLGGVASGLSKYFDVDKLVIRIIFIAMFFGFGTGLLAYIILWIITPEANSITDKMQMEGQPVTLSNIDSTVKKKKEVKEEELVEKGEGAFTTVLLFPFRLVGKIFTGISKAFSPLMLFLVSIIRVFTGGIISIVGLSVMFSMVVTAGVFMGLYSEGADWYRWGDWGHLPYEIVHDTVPGWGIAFLLISIFIPFLYVFIAGITIIAKRKVMSTSTGWSILGVWLIAILGTTATLPNVIRDFREEGVYRNTENLTIVGDTIVLDMDRDYRSARFDRDFSSDDFDLIDLDIRQSSDGEFRLDTRIYSRGRTVRDAEENAQMIDYDLDISEGNINFPSNYTFKRNGRFRAQELDLILYIPKDKPFQIKRGMSDIMRYFSRAYDWWEIYRNTWMFTDDGLICLNCEEDKKLGSRDGDANYSRTLDLDDFDDIEIDNDFDVVIVSGDAYEISLQGDEYKVRDVEVRVSGSKLKIDYDGDLRRDDVYIEITTPKLKSLDVQNQSTVEIKGFEDEDLTVKTYDDAKVTIDANLHQLSLYLTDDSSLSLAGTVQDLRASLIENSRLYAFDAVTKSAEVGTNAESRARVNVSDYLKAEAKGFSTIRYKGSPELDVIDQGRSANISAY